MRRKARRLQESGSGNRLERLGGTPAAAHAQPSRPGQEPPSPPLLLTPQVAADPDTDRAVLWHIARNLPDLRRWLVVNPKADAYLLEYIAQAGGPGVHRALQVLLDSLDRPGTT